MKIKDIIKNSAILLALNNIVTSIENLTEENEAEILNSEDMFKIFNIVKLSFQDVCTHYLTVRSTEQIEVVNKNFETRNLPNLIRVEKVLKDGIEISFKVVNREILFEENGVYTIQYLTYPNIKSLNDDIDYFENFDPQVFIYSICAYYSLSVGAFEEFESFHRLFEDNAEKLKELKVFTIPVRSWE